MDRPHRALLVVHDPSVRAAVTEHLEGAGWQVHHDDSTQPSSVERLRLLVVDVPVPPSAPFVGGDVRQWYAEVHAAASRPFLATRSALPALRAAGEARVVVLGAGWESVSVPGGTAAATAHGGLVAFVKTLARDLGPEGITVNQVVRDPRGPVLAEQVARTVAYLAGDAAGATTGQLIGIGRTVEVRP